MFTHNPKQKIQELQTILSSPKIKIGFLFGAGVSMKGIDEKDLIPGLDDKEFKEDEKTIVVKKGMTTLSIEDLSVDQKSAIELIRAEIEEKGKFNVETLLSKISEKENAVGSQTLCGLTKDQLTTLRKAIEEKITQLVSVHQRIIAEDTNQNTFVQWVKHAERDCPIEIFTTNYDYLFELALERHQMPYFDGFVGSYEAFFCPDWIENGSSVKNWVKLWKLHGSLGWDQKDNEIIRISGPTGAKSKAMIYPSFLKYSHSKKQPYLSYMDRLSSFLRQEDVVLFVCGYSFGDEHINEIIRTSLNRSRSSHVFIFKSSDLKEGDVVAKIAEENSRISAYAQRHAVIGCKFGKWKMDREPDSNESYNILDYAFDEDAAQTKDDAWTGEGNFRLGDFKFFTDFLSLFYNNSKYIKKGNEK